MAANLLLNPRCTAADLGLPMPDSPHAVSACLPLWVHNIGYEEGDAAIIASLQAAYPRFCLHPLVRQVIEQVFQASTDRPDDSAVSGFVFPSHRSAAQALDYFHWRGGSGGRLVPIAGQNACGVEVPIHELKTLREYWQHAGEVVSSRAAEQILAGKPVQITETTARQTVKNRIAELQQVSANDVRLYPSGMAAISAAWRILRAERPHDPSIQFGFPYVDTLKIQERFRPAVCRFFPAGVEDDLLSLETLLRTESISALFCEAPANPLLSCPDLRRLRQLADQYNFLLVVDDTLAACVNLDVRPLADIVVTSLTKYFSGYGDVLAGSLTLNPAGRHYERLLTLLQQDFEELLADVDVDVLESNSKDLRQRMELINANAAELAARLQRHPAVQTVWYPTIRSQPAYEQLRTADGGCGGLLSILLRDPANTTPRVFDALQVCKGPNLGTCFTLCCPYTILAHYNELDFAESCGVSRWLLRISVGTEPLEDLWQRFDRALNTSLRVN